MILSDELKRQGFQEVGEILSDNIPPKDWDGGEIIYNDGTVGIPPNWAWMPFNDLQVFAYKPKSKLPGQTIYEKIAADRKSRAEADCKTCKGEGWMKIWEGDDPAITDCYCIGGGPPKNIPSSCGHD